MIRKKCVGIILVLAIAACGQPSPNSDNSDSVIKQSIQWALRHISSKKTFQYLPKSKGEKVSHRYFSLAYEERYEQAIWVAYSLKASQTTGTQNRKTYFKTDTKVSTGSASHADYSHSGFDRGHLVPAKDRAFSIKSMAESFLVSNISPQKPKFNRGIWKKLENKVRHWAQTEEQLYIVTGPLFLEETGSIGKNKVRIPSHFYKIILDLYPRPKAIAFLMANKHSNQPLDYFVVSIDEIEEKSHIDFFPALEDDIETHLEKSRSKQGWFVSFTEEKT